MDYAVSVNVKFDVEIVRSCADASLTDPTSVPVIPSVTLNTFSPSQIKMWLIDLYQINTTLDCGSYTMTWKQTKDGGPTSDVEPSVFQINEDAGMITIQ